MSSTFLPNIQTIVHLTMENRSMDFMLGWLYANQTPNVVVPAGSGPFQGLSDPPSGQPYSNVSYGVTYPAAEGTLPASKDSVKNPFMEPMRTPRADPSEGYPDVTKQCWSDGDGNVPENPWSSAATAPMSGFARNYQDAGSWHAVQEVMGAYSPAQLPVLNQLAQHFAVSDRWFSSAPTQTNANRAFGLCGTSLGSLLNGTPRWFDAPTIFNALGGNVTWGLYYQYDNDALIFGKLASGDPGPAPGRTDAKCYTGNLFPQIGDAVQAGHGAISPWATFVSQAASGTLPQYCYLEPYWGGGLASLASHHLYWGVQGNDYHPCAWLGPAEAFLNELYTLLYNSPQWSSMLLIITFDEHGGTYDHVSPTRTVAPDRNTYPGSEPFDFTWLGVRVPTILVSPYVQPGTVFRAPAGASPQADFDHTSIIATVLKWAGVDPATAGLGARVAIAPTFESALTDTPCAVTLTPPLALPQEPGRPGYAEQGGGVGTNTGLSPIHFWGGRGQHHKPSSKGHQGGQLLHDDASAGTPADTSAGSFADSDSPQLAELRELVQGLDLTDHYFPRGSVTSIEDLLDQLRALVAATPPTP